MYTLQKGCAIYDERNGKEIGRQMPVNAMLCNFPKPTADRPSLLSHGNVVTFFHEFGHVMHQICGQTQLARFSGTSVQMDFAEAPSQMLENWCWQPESLHRMSGHFSDPEGKRIPEEMLNGLIKSKNVNSGLSCKRQLFYGMLDQIMHTANGGQIDTAKLCAELQLKIWGIPPMEGTNFVAGFGHLAGGYEAQYYGYMWSEVYSADMFYTLFGERNLLNPVSGMAYRKKILSRGGARDARELLCDFLEREPNNKAFLKSKGVMVEEEDER